MGRPDSSSSMMDTFLQVAGALPQLNKADSPKGMPTSGGSLHPVTDGFIQGIKSGPYT